MSDISFRVRDVSAVRCTLTATFTLGEWAEIRQALTTRLCAPRTPYGYSGPCRVLLEATDDLVQRMSIRLKPDGVEEEEPR